MNEAVTVDGRWCVGDVAIRSALKRFGRWPASNLVVGLCEQRRRVNRFAKGSIESGASQPRGAKIVFIGSRIFPNNVSGRDAPLDAAYYPLSACTVHARFPAGTDWRPRQYGEQTAAAIDAAVRDPIEAAFRQAVTILATDRALLDRAARGPLAKETMSGEELKSLAAQLALSSAVASSSPGVAA